MVAALRTKKNCSIFSSVPAVSGSKIPNPKLCVVGASIPSNTAAAPPISTHSEPLSGNSRTRASANCLQAYPSAASSLLASSRSENVMMQMILHVRRRPSSHRPRALQSAAARYPEGVHMRRLVLASASPRRRELLTQAGFTFAIHPAHIPEDPLPGEDPISYVIRLAREKA